MKIQDKNLGIWIMAHLKFTCTKSTIEAAEKGVKYVWN